MLYSEDYINFICSFPDYILVSFFLIFTFEHLFVRLAFHTYMHTGRHTHMHAHTETHRQ